MIEVWISLLMFTVGTLGTRYLFLGTKDGRKASDLWKASLLWGVAAMAAVWLIKGLELLAELGK